MPLFPKRRMLVLLGLLTILALVLVGRWLNANKIGGQGPAEQFRIAGNFYYVGATDVSAFLITGPEGASVSMLAIPQPRGSSWQASRSSASTSRTSKCS